ncbi:hypothetical protein [Streptomyces sp. NPDC004546]|uniref:hypothetical protein n=1 Tax=Streptomyces sp. NPDC004546 TaxID=3154282 RepID=UPI0033BE3CF9
MEEQHQAIDQAHAEASGLLSGWRRTGRGGEELARAFEVLLSALLEHMATEEKHVLPLAEKHVTAAEWRELGEHGMAKTPKWDVPLTFGMAMYEGDPRGHQGGTRPRAAARPPAGTAHRAPPLRRPRTTGPRHEQAGASRHAWLNPTCVRRFDHKEGPWTPKSHVASARAVVTSRV